MAGEQMVKTLLHAVRRFCRVLPTGAVLAGALVGAGGCRCVELAEQRVALRGERLARTVDMAARHERSRPQRLARTSNEIHRRVRRDAEASGANVDEIKLYWQRQWQRWVERQSVYRDEAGRILLGKPDHIERNAIILFF